MADSIKLWWAWRKKSNRTLRRSSLLFLTALFFAIAALTAGIFTSYVVSTSNLEILVDSPLCRQINLTSFRTGGNPVWGPLNKAVETYSETCYANTSMIPAVCRNTFTRPVIPFTKEPADCPWDSSMCLGGDKPAIAMDTGLLDVNEYLGINLAKADTVRYRKRTTCNPLPLEGHVDIRPMSDFEKIIIDKPEPGEQAIGLRFGRLDFPDDEFPEYTYIGSLLKANYTKGFGSRARISYTSGDPDLTSAPLEPLPEMKRSDADVVVTVVWMNNVHYNEPVNDPVYAGHHESNYTYNGENITIYHPDAPAGMIGCMEQYQFCISQRGDKEFCTPLSYLPLEFTKQDLPKASDVQLSVLSALRMLSAINDITNGPLLELIKSNEIITTPNSREIQDDQWINEITYWQSYAMAGIQTMLSDIAIGPVRRDPAADEYTDAPTTPGMKAFCSSMKMRKAGGFANVNVFGLAFILSISGTLILLNLFILRFILFLSKFRRALAPRIERWAQDGIFQLQRRAFDAHGEGNWTDLEKEIPSTITSELLDELPVESLPMWRTKLRSDREKKYDDIAPMSPISDGDTLRMIDTRTSTWGANGKDKDFGGPKKVLTEDFKERDSSEKE